MDTIAIGTSLTVEDWRALQTQAAARLAGSETAGQPWWRLLMSTAFFAVLALGIAGLFGSGALALDAKSVVVGALIVFAATIVNARLALRRAAPAANGLFLGPCAYELDRAGLRAGRGDSNSFCAWRAVHDVTRTDTHAFVWVDRFSAYVVPGRDLPGALTLERLVEWIAAARAGAAAEPASEIEPGAARLERAAAASLAQPPRRSGAWLLDLMNLVALRGKAVLTQSSHGLAATLLTLLAVGTWVAFNRWAYGPGAVFYVYGIPSVAWYLLGGLVIAWLLARASTPRIGLAGAVAVSALGAWLAVLYFYLAEFVPGRWAALALLVAVVLYVPAYFAQAARSLTGQAQPAAGLAAFLGTLGFFWGTESLYIYPTVWVPGETEDEPVYSRDDIEPLLFAQPERVDAAVAAVPAGDPAATDWFFVGFAGYGDEKVFAEEIQFAARVIGERYRSATRSVLLLNDQRDLDAAPLATASTLRRALRGVADKMALDDDVLFLALSSHGSSDWELSVRNGVMPLANLTPAELDGALDDAGIRWRVIVISACYAGGFIETLQDPYTIVLAAAAPDRTSFGCSNERELTYFGEAFYRDSLPVAASLRGAFATAERLVGEREAAEVITPSQPMAFFGEELERKLASLEGRP